MTPQPANSGPDPALLGEPFARVLPAFLRPLAAAGIATLLAVLLFQLNLTARRNSITWDEDDHVYAGYMSWKHADFGLNPEHPPQVKLLAALPLLELPLPMPP